MDGDILARAVAHHQAGRLSEAAQGYHAVLEADPDQPDALHLLGVVALQSRQPEPAVELIGRAIERDRRVPDYWDNYGSALAALGRHREAAKAHETAVSLNPDFAAAWHNLGNALHALSLEGLATVAYSAALSVRPDYAKAWYNFANALRAAGRLPDAIAALGRAVRIAPGMVEAHNNLGDALAASGRLAEAVAAHRKVVQLRPDDPNAHYNLGSVLQQRGAYEGAEIAYREALRRQPRHAPALNNLGSVLKRLGRPDQAELCHRQALELHPEFVEARYNLGNALQALGRYEEAEATYEEALAQNPDLATASYNLALLALLRGDLHRGWSGYERRFAAAEVKPNRHIPVPAWTGEVLRGRRLLVWREQGVGDELMFASCYQDVVEWGGGPVTIECDRRLVTLFRRSFPKATVRAESCTEEAEETILPPDCDVQVAAGSLPRHLRDRLPSFEPRERWLQPDPQLAAKWRRRLDQLGPGLKVGIGWRSQLMTAERRGAYTTLDQWHAVFEIPGVVFVNLQYDDCATEIAEAGKRFGVRIHRWRDLDLMDDFENAAALVANLDLVISPAMSAGELAGALGVPVWRFGGRDWTQLGTAVRPWFPTMRLFQPRPGETLEDVLGHIAAALRRTGNVTGTALRSPDPEELLSEAIDLHRSGRLEEAAAAYEAVLQIDPEHADALHLLGLTLHQSGAQGEAVICMREAIRLVPDFPTAWNHLGLVHQAEDRNGAAEECFRRALALRPDFPEALTHLGLRRHKPAMVEQARRLHRRSIALFPENPAPHTNIGHTCELQGRFAEASAHYRVATALRPEAPDAYNNLATMAKLAGRGTEAIRQLTRSLVLDADFALSAWNLGLLELEQGLIAQGWAGYERRFSARQLQRARRISRPKWRGEPLKGRTLLVWSEQGVGDEILFASCIADLERLLDTPGSQVIVECDRRLVPLFARAFPWAIVRAETADARNRETIDPPDCDLQIAAGSLPALLRDRLDRFPPAPSYLVPSPTLLEVWRARVSGLPGLRVGITWRSQVVTAQRESAYTRLVDWAPLFRLPGVSLVNLQYGDCTAEIAQAAAAGHRLHRWDDLDLKDDFENVAALVSNLDLVISPATAVGELAGALGVPVWRLCGPDWTQLGCAVRPWFPSMRLFQPRSGEALPDMIGRAAAQIGGLAVTH